MRFEEPGAFRASLEARLRQDTREPQDLSRRRRMVAFDRFLARLAAADHRGWVLKGGAALEFRMPDRARTTRDIDLALLDEVDPVERILDDIDRDPFGDHFSFRVTRRRELSEGPDRGAVVRLSLDAVLAGRTFERFVVDIAPGAGGGEATETVELGEALAFAGVPSVEMAVIDRRVHWAEKLSAYVRRYDGRPNTRVKDLVDLVLLVDHGLVADDRLLAAVEATFRRRNQELPGEVLPSMAEAWAAPFAQMASEVGLSSSSSAEAHALVESMWRRALESRSG